MPIVPKRSSRPPWSALLGLPALLWLVPGNGPAAIYKCIDARGHVSYLGRACPEGESLARTFRDAPAPYRPAPPSRGGSGGAPGGSEESGEEAPEQRSPDPDLDY